jgi:effector-binding domain-containing protein
MSYEKLNYQVLKKEKNIELRCYDAFMIMKVKRTSNQGFGVLFQYISGYNSKRQKIQMTIPVLTDVESSDYIAFTMPKVHTNDYPDPIDPNIEMIQMPMKNYLSISFKGSHHHAKKAFEDLEKYAKDHQIKICGDPILLRYNGPFTLSFLKDNDVIVEIISQNIT